MKYSGALCMSCRRRAAIIVASSICGSVLVVIIAITTCCLCKQKRRAEKAKQKLTHEMAGCEETVVKLDSLLVYY